MRTTAAIFVTWRARGRRISALPSALLWLLGATGACAQSGALPVVLTCPATLDTTQSAHGAVPAGWAAELPDGKASPNANASASADSKVTHRLSSVQFTAGPLHERAFLVPENEHAPTRRGRPMAARWAFDGPQTPHMVCYYHGTAVRLTQPLPAGTTHCEAVRDAAPPAVAASARCWR